jgi:PAS domain S-box-containing protein
VTSRTAGAGSEARLRALLESTRAIPWEANAKTWQFTYVGPQAVELLGYPIESWYEKDFWTSHIHPDDLKFAVDFCQESSARVKDYEFDYRMITSSGSIVWLHDVVSVASVNGSPETLRGFMIDITERKLAQERLRDLSGRLIHAQEEERRRIARELHDDVSQRLALLSMEMDQLSQGPRESPARLVERMQEIRTRIHELSSDLHRISYELHPAKLEHLGLVAAVRSFCKDLSRQHGVRIEFIDRDIPRAIHQDIALCLFRIVQESLRNAVKHSGTAKAQVELSGSPDAIRLRVSDSGIGFDARGSKRNGLGLVSMEERLRLVGGEIAIDSQPSQGTRIDVRVPLP